MDNLDLAFERIDQLVKGHLDYYGTPGLSLAVTDRDNTLRISTYGVLDVSSRAEVQPGTLFQIGSISKSFACIAAMQLVDEGRLAVDDHVTKHVPWFSVRSSYGPISVHHLMTHTAGIVLGSDATISAETEIMALRETETSSPPGTHFHYSNSGYKLLGLVLQNIEGKHWSEVLRRRILDPIGMSSTETTITDAIRPRTATGHVSLMTDRPWKRGGPFVPGIWFESDTADGAISSTPGDMTRYMRLLLNGGEFSGRRLVSPGSFQKMTTPHISTCDGVHGTSYGYGLNLEELEGHRLMGHGGGMVGHYSSMLLDTTTGVGVTVMVNGDGTPDSISRYCLGVVVAALGGEELPQPPIPPERIKNAIDYSGTYKSGGRTLVIEARGEALVMKHGCTEIPLEKRGDESYLADHPDFDEYLILFGRKDGDVAELLHGPDWYVADRYEEPGEPEHPPEWDAYVGHYVSHNPWMSNFKVVIRKGALVFIPPMLEEEPMTPLPEGGFRVGRDPLSPERIGFDLVMGGSALRANLSGGPYYRKIAL